MSMRKFLLATTAAAVALTLTGRVFAETNPQLPLRKFVTDQAQTSGQTSGQGSAETAKPAEPAAKPSSAELSPLSQQLKELTETRLNQYVPREQDRAGVLAFYRGRNFAPLWAGDGKPQPQAA